MNARQLTIEEFNKMIEENNDDSVQLYSDPSYASQALANANRRIEELKKNFDPKNVPEERKQAWDGATELQNLCIEMVPAKFGPESKLDGEAIRKVMAIEAAISKMPFDPKAEKAVQSMIGALYRNEDRTRYIHSDHPIFKTLQSKYRQKKGDNIVAYARSNERDEVRDQGIINWLLDPKTKESNWTETEINSFLNLLRSTDPTA